MATRGAVTAGDAIYARYSSELQNPRSCDDQVTELRQALERRGGTFDRKLVFSDSEVSGGVWMRDGLQALLMAVETGRIIRGLILMQAEGDRSPLVAQMRTDLEAQAETERTAIEDRQAQATAPIRLPPVELLTDRVLALRALTDSPDVERARAALKRYLRDGTITLSPDVGPDGKPAYVARAEFLPLVFLTENAETPSEGYQGGRCPRSVARARNSTFLPSNFKDLRRCGCRSRTRS